MTRSHIPNPEGKGLVFDKHEREVVKQKKEYRLGVVEKLIEEEGFTNIPALTKRLEDFGIKVTSQCVRRDLDKLNMRGGFHKRRALSILGKYQAKLNEIEKLIKAETDKKELRHLYKLWSGFQKDYATVLSKLGANLEGEYKPAIKESDEINIKFEDEKHDEKTNTSKSTN